MSINREYKENKDREEKGNLNKGSACFTHFWIPLCIYKYSDLSIQLILEQHRGRALTFCAAEYLHITFDSPRT